MRKLIFVITLFSAQSVMAQTFGTVNMWMAQPSASVGTTVTPTILGQYSLPASGCPAAAWSISGTAAKVGASQGSLGASLTAGGITYPSTQPTLSLAFDDGSNFSYVMCSSVPGGSTMTIAGYYTPNYALGVFSVADLVRMDASTPNSFVILQLALNGATQCIRAHAGSSGDVGTPCINITPGQRLFYNLTAQAGVGTTVRLYNASTFALIGTSFLASSGTASIGTPFRWYLGNVEAATSAGHTDFFEDTMTTSASSVLPSGGPTQLWSSVLASSRAIDWTQSGVTGGIPSASWTQCGATMASTSTAAQINTRISGCAAGTFVQLAAGVFALTDAIVINNKSNVGVRGMGADQTFLVLTNGTTTCGGGAPVAVCIRATDGNFSGGPSNVANWTSGFSQGTTAITTSAFTNLKVGNYGILDQLDDDASRCDDGGVLIGDVITTCAAAGIGSPTAPGISAPYSGQGNGGGARTNRGQQQIVKIVSCGTSTLGAACTSGNLVISPGLYMPNWSATKTPQMWWATSPSQFVGLENFSIDNTNSGQNATACSGGVGIGIYNSPNSWVTGVRDVDSTRAHVQILYSPHLSIRNNYFWGTQNRTSCSYGVEVFSTSDSLIENNIFQAIASPYMSNGPDAGVVFGYNYSILNLYTAGSLFTANAHGDHDAGNALALIEGNVGNVINADVIHGSGNFQTYFRNRYSGQSICWQSSTDNSSTSQVIATGTFNNCTANTSPFVVNSFHRFYNLIGNVVGTTGANTGYDCVTNSGGTLVCGSGTAQNFVLGEGNPGFSPAVPNDPNVGPTIMRWGNADPATGFASPRFFCAEVPTALTGVQAPFLNVCPSTTTLPASFYYSSKPPWWPTGKVWPPIGPDVSAGNISGTGGRANTIPAQDCFLSLMSGPANGVSAPLTFNGCASSSGGTSGAVLLSTTTIAFGSRQVGPQSTLSTVTVTNNGTATLTINSITLTGANTSDFALVNSCGTTLAVNAVCLVQAKFAPTSTGAKTASITLSDSAADTPQAVSLSGTGIQGLASLAPTSLNFNSQTVNTVSAASPIVITNTGAGTLTISSISASGDFGVTHNCPLSPSSIASGASCTVQVTFHPIATGVRSGVLTIASDGTGSPQTAALGGTSLPAVACGMSVAISGGLTLSGGGMSMSCP